MSKASLSLLLSKLFLLRCYFNCGFKFLSLSKNIFTNSNLIDEYKGKKFVSHKSVTLNALSIFLNIENLELFN